MATIIIPTPLRKFTNNESKFETESSSIKDAIAELTLAFEPLKKHLLDEQGKIRSFIKVFVGDEDIEDLSNEETAIEKGTVVSIVPAIAGGID